MYNPNENRFGDPEDQFTRPPRRAASPMALAAVSCAIIGILSVFTGIGALVFGSLAILFARLSQGDKAQPERPAKYAFRVGIIAIIISAVMMAVSFTFVFRQYGSLSNFYRMYVHTMEQQYGVDLDDSLFPGLDTAPEGSSSTPLDSLFDANQNL